MALGKRKPVQQPLFISTADLNVRPHPFYEAVNKVGGKSPGGDSRTRGDLQDAVERFTSEAVHEGRSVRLEE